MMVAILAKTDKVLLLGLSIPLYDALILRTGVDMLIIDLKPCNAQSVTFILLSFCKPQRRI